MTRNEPKRTNMRNYEQKRANMHTKLKGENFKKQSKLNIESNSAMAQFSEFKTIFWGKQSEFAER